MLYLLLACTPAVDEPGPKYVPPDLTERLGAGEVRAGQVTDAASLIGGISAEGGVGDYVIYNDRAKFVIEAPGPSSYYVEYGGGIIDADIVRDEGAPGRDILDELHPMIGLGRLVDVTSVTVVSDGADGAAVLRVEGTAAPMHLVTGALESDAVVPEMDLRVRTDLVLEPGAWSLRATTTVWNDEDEAVTVEIGDVALVAMDVAEGWRPGTGRADPSEAPVDWMGAFSHGNEVALAIAADTTPIASGTVGRILAEVAPAIAGFGPSVTIEPGASSEWSRWIGVAPDLATLTGEQLTRSGAATKTVSGTVTADGPVAGARVHVLDGTGAPLTVAATDASGAWNATVPDTTLSYVASGRGPSLQVDLPAGAGWVSPYDPDPAATLDSFSGGAPAIPFAEGYGVSAPSSSTDLVLTAPGTLDLTIADGGPAVVIASFVGGDPVAADERLVPGRPKGAGAVAFVRDGSMSIALEPGSYEVLVHRGVRDELVRETVTITSGAATALTADIVPAYELDGIYTIDPHSHASPSGDGGIPMADRLVVTTANGVDIHVGTDHDHVADYRPLLAPLGLDQRLRSVVATEVSPVLRGHFNAWPATVDATQPNNGAPRWWLGYETTAEIFGWMRELVGEEGIISANHPVGNSGMFTLSGYNGNGEVAQADKWSSDFDAMELINDGDWEDNLPYYFDLVNRGKLVTPVSVSDSHAHTSGGVGLNVTFIEAGVPLAELDDATLVYAMERKATVASHGPYIDARIAGAWAPGVKTDPGATLTVQVKAPSWMPVETVSLYENGELVVTEPCTGVAPTPCDTSFLLDPMSDASYVVIAQSTTQSMDGAHAGNLAWAATSAILVDVDGDGWEAPLPPIEVGR